MATLLEAATGQWPSFEDLAERALPYRDTDEEAETWWTVVGSLSDRGDHATFDAAVRMCAAEDPRRREFAVDVLAQFGFREGDKPFLEASLPVLRRMAVTEGDERVLRSLLGALGHHADPRALPEVLGIITAEGGPAPRRTRRRWPRFCRPVTPRARAARLDDRGPRRRRPRLGDHEPGRAGGGHPADPRRAGRPARRPGPRHGGRGGQGLSERGDPRARAGIERVLAESDDDYARGIVEDL
nr:hypothetical protein GCM10020093_040490 [Planobispora longispora]